MIRWKQHCRHFWHPRPRSNHLFNTLPWLLNQSDWVTGLRLLVDLSLTWKCASWSGRCRSSTSGVLGPFTTNEDRQTAKNGEGSLAPLLAWVAACKKKSRRKPSQRAPALRSYLSGLTSAKVSCAAFVCGGASQPTLDRGGLSAGSFHFQC